MTQGGRQLVAKTAQSLAQALTAWGLILLWATTDLDQGRVMWTILLVLALVMPVRTKPGHHDRAVSNFASGLVIWCLTALDIMASVILFWSGLLPQMMTPVQMILLCATALFMFAGAFFWINARRSGETA
jgi:hypothetical protein